MNTEVTQQEKEVNIIRLPSIEDILNNLRYLLSALLLVLGAFGLISSTKQINPNINSILLAIILILSGGVLAFTPHKNITQPYKYLGNMPLFEKVTHIILTVIWAIGWFFGFLILVIMIVLFLKI